jgi:hypothetical protein
MSNQNLSEFEVIKWVILKMYLFIKSHKSSYSKNVFPFIKCGWNILGLLCYTKVTWT